jgi:hemolysin activation/secretion protein
VAASALHAESRPDPASSASSAVTQDGTPIPVRHLRVTGATLFPSAELEALVADLGDGTRTLSELTDGAARITRFYRDHGWPLARAVLPPQSIHDGEVEIHVIEGRLAEVQIRTEPGSRLLPSVIESRLAAIPRGAPLNQEQIDRVLLLLSDLPGARATARLQAGAQTGDTILSIDNATAPLISGRLDADNHGSRYTGERRLGGSLDLNSPTGHGESIGLRLMASDQDLYYGRLSAQIPIGSSGLSTALNLTHTQYVLGSAFADLDAHGQANVAEWLLAYPLVRGSRANIGAQFGVERRRLADEVGVTATTTGKRATHYSLQLTFSGQDDTGAGADTRIGLRVGYGRLDFTSPSAGLIDQLSARTAGHYGTLNLDLQRNQRFGGGWGLLMALSGQLASRNLDSYQKFALGGVNGVRGYPAGEAVGDEGWLASGELYHAVNAAFIPSLFYNAGGVRLNETPFLTGRNVRTLRGYGAAVRGSWRDLDWSVSIAARGSERAQSEPDRGVRVWARMGWAF